MKALITITTCNRLPEVQKYIWEYLNFVNKNDDFHFVLALDGKEQAYIDFCDQYDISLLYSEEREGVGMSKNRVLKQFPRYDYYFFLDDDVEMVDMSVFEDNINASKLLNIPHLAGIVSGEDIQKIKIDGFEVWKGFKAGGYFNFFDAEFLIRVGGWHTHFVQYKRFGHSEHSYRFYHAGFQDFPLICINSSIHKLIIHHPPHVTFVESSQNLDHFHPDEIALINEKLTSFPLQTICSFYFNNKTLGYNAKIAAFLKTNKKRYPLTKGKMRRVALADHYFLRINTTTNFLKKILFFLKSMFYYPFNIPFKHYLKIKFFNHDK